MGSSTPGVWTLEVTWFGGTLVDTLDVRCPNQRMVGKGTITDAAGVAASYVYIHECTPLVIDSLPAPSPPFRLPVIEVRFGTQRFRNSGLEDHVGLLGRSSCGHAGGRLRHPRGVEHRLPRNWRGHWRVRFMEWKFVDGGAGGANNHAQITIRNAANNAVVFQGSRHPTRQVPRLHPNHRLQHRPAAALGVVPEEVGSSGPPWRLGAAKHPSPKEDTGWIFTLTPRSA